MNYKSVTDSIELNEKDWSDFVKNHPCGNIFHTPYFYQACVDSKEYEPVIILISGGQTELSGLLISYIQREGKGVIGRLSSRSIIFGGPLIKDNNFDVYQNLLSAYENTIKKLAIYSQFRNLWNISKYKNPFDKFGYKFKEHLNIFVDLEKSEEQLWKEVHSKRRNEIRRAKREGVVFSVESSIDALKRCYEIIEEVYSYAKLPYPSFTFFKALFENSQERIGLKLFTAKYNDEIIGCMLGFVFKDTIYDFYAGSYRKFYNKYPNDLIPWEVFLWGKENGYKTFDFGGAGKPGVSYGVRDYKKKFGGELVNFGRYEKIHKPFLMKIGKMGLKIWQKLK